MKRNYRLYIKDILDASEKIEVFIGELSFDEFIENDEKTSAVIRKLEIIGEATKNVPPVIREKYRKAPWKDMAGMRDKLIHSYFGINLEIIWKVVKERLPEIKLLMEQILEEDI